MSFFGEDISADAYSATPYTCVSSLFVCLFMFVLLLFNHAHKSITLSLPFLSLKPHLSQYCLLLCICMYVYVCCYFTISSSIYLSACLSFIAKSQSDSLFAVCLHVEHIVYYHHQCEQQQCLSSLSVCVCCIHTCLSYLYLSIYLYLSLSIQVHA